MMYEQNWRAGMQILVSVLDDTGGEQPIYHRFRKIYNLDGRYCEENVGSVCVLATMWPAPTCVKPKSAVLSLQLYKLLGNPEEGCTIQISMADEYTYCERAHVHLIAELSPLCNTTPGELLKPNEQSTPQSSKSITPKTLKSRGNKFVAMSPSMRQSMQASPKIVTPSAKALSVKDEEEPGRTSPPSEFVVANMDTLRNAIENSQDGKVVAILKSLFRSRMKGVSLLPGNIVCIQVLGVSIVGAVHCSPKISKNAYVNLDKIDKMQIILYSDSGSSLDTSEDGPSYASQAVEAVVKDLVVEVGDTVAQSVHRAAWLGEISLNGTSMGQVGGLEEQLAILRHWISFPLQHFGAFGGIAPPTGVLLHGPPGTGKTLLARELAKEANCALFVLNGSDVMSEFMGESERCLHAIFHAARSLSPSIIFIDEIDALGPTRSQETSSSRAASRMVATLADDLDSLHGSPVIVIGATNRLSSLDDSLRRPGRLEREIEVPVPSPSDRRSILMLFLSLASHSLTESDIDSIAEKTHGYVGADIRALCSEAAMCCLRRFHSTKDNSQLVISSSDMAQAMLRVRPSALREFSADVSKVHWNDVGGNSAVKQQLKEVVEWPARYKDSLARIGAEPPRGVLLCGPPGCSKTLLVRAVAGESNYNFFSIKGPEIMSKFVGESEKALATIFDRARKASPSILFFDEIDGLVGRRSSSKSTGSVDASERVLSQLLQEMDGIRGHSHNVIVIGATNRPDRLDAALLRPGRFDRVIQVRLPEYQDRIEIFQIHTREIPVASDVDIGELASQTDGFSGAEIAAVCQRAAMRALTKSMTCTQVTMEDFGDTIENFKPSDKDVTLSAGYQRGLE